MRAAVREAIELAGGPAAAARLFEKPISREAVSQWDVCPKDRALDLSRAIQYRVTPHRLRPDMYPHRHDGLPEELRRDAAA
jgi:DNA-binding transcriptional regulator YdaS (Cro superfamily)